MKRLLSKTLLLMFATKGRRLCLVALTVSCAVLLLIWQNHEAEEDIILTMLKPRLEEFTPIKSTNQPMARNGVYQERQRTVRIHCQQKHGAGWKTILNKPSFDQSPIVSLKHNLTYCPVGKVGSSFFTRFVIAMDKPGQMTSPLKIPIEKAGRGQCGSLKSLGTVSKQREFLEKSTKIVFGRNPFSRIFSAFIDKLFSPNPFYWNYWGKHALKMSFSKAIQCASDVSFQQFVHFVVSDLHKSDVHLRPVFDECQMCHVTYDVIGKLETTKSDLEKISSVLNISSQYLNQEGYDFDSAMDAVLDSVKSAFSWKKDISKCMSLDEMGFRLWRKLQIRGIIYNSEAYPFAPGDIGKMEADHFISACRDGILASTNKTQLRKQKTQALLEAYSTVEMTDLLAISKVYSDDFITFGYDPEPYELFGNARAIQNTGSLNWKDKWVLD